MNKFWQLNQEKYDKDELINIFVNEHENLFVDNYNEWKEHLAEFNNIIKQTIKNYYHKDEEKYIDITYDEYCTLYLKEVTDVIKFKGTFTPKDIFDIVYKISFNRIKETIKDVK